VAGAGAPTVKVTQWDCQNKGYLDGSLATQWAAVPIPSYATPSTGTDAEMTIYQPSTNTIWEFWVTRKTDGNWEACWGGRLQNVSTSQGIWFSYYGTTATGLPFLGGQITAEELQRGEIRHVMGIALVEAEAWNIFSWPAQRSDGYNPNNAANRIPEGLRFRLDPTVNVDALSIHPVAKTIAKAAQKYGFVVWDKAGSISLRAQNVTSYTALGQTNPYTALFNGTPDWGILNGMPWDKLQFLPMDYGENATGTNTSEIGVPVTATAYVHSNPFNTGLTVHISSGTKLNNAVINIYGINGTKTNSVCIGSHAVTVPTHGLASGVFVYELFNDNRRIATGKFIHKPFR
jgi:hypothetical protein